LRRPERSRPRIFNPNATLSSSVMCANSVSLALTRLIRRDRGATWVISLPASQMLPALGRRKPASNARTVLLPAEGGPNSTSRCAEPSDSDRSSMATRLP
jgi:hypothetical protein